MRASVLTATILATTAGAPVAQPVDCESAETEADLSTCAARGADTVKAELAQSYDALSRSVSPAGREKLNAAMNAFATYRTAQCAFDTAGTEGGSIHSMMFAQCVETLTRAQNERLRHQLNCEEGDVSCGGQ